MSQENVAVVRRAIDALDRGDVDAVMGLASEDFEADLSNSRGPLSGVYRGRDQIGESMKTFLEAWDSLRWELEELIELEDDRVLSVSQIKMRGQGSGVDVTASGAAIWTIQAGKAARFTLYQSKAEALEASGLPDSN